MKDHEDGKMQTLVNKIILFNKNYNINTQKHKLKLYNSVKNQYQLCSLIYRPIFIY